MIPDPRYAYDKEKQYDIHRQIREDVSMTYRKPYPQSHEIGLPPAWYGIPNMISVKKRRTPQIHGCRNFLL